MTKVIELEEKDVIRESRSVRRSLFIIWMKFVFIILCAVALVGIIVSASMHISATWMKIKEIGQVKLTAAKYQAAEYLDLVHYTTKIVPVNDAKIEELIAFYSAKHGVNPIVSWAMIDKESSLNPDRIRFEQSWKDDYGKKFPKQPWMNPIEYDLIFSSYGLMQISYVLWSDFCGVTSFKQLLDPDKNIDCGLKIIRKCLDENPNMKNGQRLRLCFRQYNGSGPRAEQYANDVMSRLADYTIEDKSLLTSSASSAIITEKEASSAETISAESADNSYEITDAVYREIVKPNPVTVPEIVKKKLDKKR